MTSRVYQDLIVDGNIISKSFPAALSYYDAGIGNFAVAQPYDLFSHKFYRDIDTAIFETKTAGSGASVWNSLTAEVNLNTTTTGDRVVFQSRYYIPYQAGRTQRIIMTGVLAPSGNPSSGVTTRIGSFDDVTDKTAPSGPDNGGDGHFFEWDGSTAYVVQRKTTGAGTSSDTRVAQASWNVDPLDGTGESGITIDFTKSHLFVILREWFGVGTVKFGFDFDGQITICHTLSNINSYTGTYMQKATLPVRWEINNVSSGAAATMKAICVACLSMGGFEPKGRLFNIQSIDFTQGSTTHVFTIRLKKAYCRGRITLQNLSYSSPSFSDSETVLYSIILNGTPTGAGVSAWSDVTFTSVNSNSLVEYTDDASPSSLTISGGTVIQRGFITNHTRALKFTTDIKDTLYLCSNIAGTPDTISFVFEEILTTNITASRVIIEWFEYY